MYSQLKIQKLDRRVRAPSNATSDSAGFDLYANQTISLRPNDVKKIPTGLIIQVPIGTYGRIAPRSSMALKNLWINGGVVDRDYRGEVMIICANMSKDTYTIVKGDKVAQLICESYIHPIVSYVNELPPTERGSRGFGSSGR